MLGSIYLLWARFFGSLSVPYDEDLGRSLCHLVRRDILLLAICLTFQRSANGKHGQNGGRNMVH